MGYLLTFVFLAAVCAIVLAKAIAASRRAARERREAEAAAVKRREREQEILARLERMKRTDDLSSAKRAIERDPARAAKVVSNMMKGTSKK